MSQIAFSNRHFRRLKRLKYTQTNNPRDTGTRYGYNLHELRDLARSLLEKAKEDGFNTNSAEYWMGHTVDPFFYNKVWKIDPDYNLKQYGIAEKYLSLNRIVAVEQGQVTKELVTILANWEKAGAFQDPDTLKELIRLAKQESVR
jgi:hypothetical protein